MCFAMIFLQFFSLRMTKFKYVHIINNKLDKLGGEKEKRGARLSQN